ncbi:alpha/beta fold hydrolase [Enterococcus sp. LJL99]
MTKNKIKKPLWKRILKGLGLLIAGIVVLLGLFLAGTTIIHQVSLKTEAKEIKSYGEKIDLFDGQINVVSEGSGEKTIFLLPGQGTASPYLDFKPLIDELKSDYRIITVEPFGYGLSSQTNRERTIENYVEELHEVAKKMNIKEYYLMGHSIAGLYAVNYAQIYPDEMQGFIGIDSSTPEQPWPGIDMRAIDFLKTAGIFRFMMKLNPEGTIGRPQSDPDFEQLKLLTLKNGSSRNMSEELQELSNSFPNSRGLTYPKNMPVLLFVAKNESNMDHWLEYHEDQVKGLDKGKVIELEGKHYLHHTQTPEIAKQIKLFLNSDGKKA